MTIRSIVSHKQRLDSLIDKASQLNDPEILAHWSRYLCVLISGFIEESVRNILIIYAANKSNQKIARFITLNLKDFQNAKMNKILDLAGEFSDAKKISLEKATLGELKEAIDSVVTNRHQIAHGKDVGISFVTVKEYYGRVVKVIEILEGEFGT